MYIMTELTIIIISSVVLLILFPVISSFVLYIAIKTIYYVCSFLLVVSMYILVCQMYYSQWFDNKIFFCWLRDICVWGYHNVLLYNANMLTMEDRWAYRLANLAADCTEEPLWS